MQRKNPAVITAEHSRPSQTKNSGLGPLFLCLLLNQPRDRANRKRRRFGAGFRTELVCRCRKNDALRIGLVGLRVIGRLAFQLRLGER